MPRWVSDPVVHSVILIAGIVTFRWVLGLWDKDERRETGQVK